MPASHPLLEAGTLRRIEAEASDHLGRRWTADSFTDLNDRASHPCGVLHGRPFSVFAKLSSAPNGVAQFSAELLGLEVVRRRAAVTIPQPVASGVVDLEPVSMLLFEALAERPPAQRTTDDWASIGHALAALHSVDGPQFGMDFDGFFGPLAQDNGAVATNRWADFYAERRVLPLLRTAIDSGHLPAALAAEVDLLVDRLPGLCGPEPRPTLLHGDAQQNNFLSAPGGAVVVDAAPYFGHAEIDLALLDYFRPVPTAVFDAYREVRLIDPDFADRRELWRIFCYLAVVTVDGASPFGRPFVARLAAAVDAYR